MSRYQPTGGNQTARRRAGHRQAPGQRHQRHHDRRIEDCCHRARRRTCHHLSSRAAMTCAHRPAHDRAKVDATPERRPTTPAQQEWTGMISLRRRTRRYGATSQASQRTSITENIRRSGAGRMPGVGCFLRHAFWLAGRPAGPVCHLTSHIHQFRDARALGQRWRGSPLTVETSVVVIMAGTGWPYRTRAWPGQACGLPAFPVPRGRSGLRGQGRPAGPSPEGRCAAPLRPEGRPRTLSGRGKASGGEAASVARPAQRAHHDHAASFPASDRS